MSRVGRRRRHPQLTLVTGLGPAARASRSTTPRSAASAPAEGPGAADADMRPLSPRSRPPATAGRCTPASRSCAGSAPAKPNACAPGSRPEPPSSATAANGLAALPRSRVVHQRHVAGSGRAATRHPAFRWANTGARQRQEQPPGHPPPRGRRQTPAALPRRLRLAPQPPLCPENHRRASRHRRHDNPPMPDRILKLAEARW